MPHAPVEPALGGDPIGSMSRSLEPEANPRNPAELWHPAVEPTALPMVGEERVVSSDVVEAAVSPGPAVEGRAAGSPDSAPPASAVHPTAENPAVEAQNETVLAAEEAIDEPASRTWGSPRPSLDEDHSDSRDDRPGSRSPARAGDLFDPFHPSYAERRTQEQAEGGDGTAGTQTPPSSGQGLIAGPTGRRRRTEPIPTRRARSLFGPPDDEQAATPKRTTIRDTGDEL